MLRFSLGTLLLVVLLVALACAAMTNPTLIWSQVVFTSAVLLVLIATVVAAFSSGTIRSFAGGFAIFGWGYLLLIFGPWAASVKPQLLTTASLGWLQSMSEEKTNEPAINSQGFVLTDATSASLDLSVSYLTSVQGLVRVGQPATNGNHFHEIGQSLWTLVLACVGGLLARMVYVWDLQRRVQKPEIPQGGNGT